MSDHEKFSPFIRAISGVMGVLGFVAIAFNAAQGGGIRLSAMLVASFFAGFIFLYVSFFGKYPWQGKDTDKSEK